MRCGRTSSDRKAPFVISSEFWPERSLRLVEPIQGWPLGGDVRHSNFNLLLLGENDDTQESEFNRVTLKTVDFWHFRFLISNSFPFLCLLGVMVPFVHSSWQVARC